MSRVEAPPVTKITLTVLVADDEPAVVGATKRALTQAGFCAIGTSELSDLEPLLDRHRPPATLLDNMWDGVSVLPRLATLVRGHPFTQFCLFSAYPARSFVAQAFAARARGFQIICRQRCMSRSGPFMRLDRRDTSCWWRGCSSMCALGIHDGFIEKEIAARIGISVDTVHTHLHDACERLRNRGVRNQTSLGVLVGESLARRTPKWRPQV